jgi:hypothetical protein
MKTGCNSLDAKYSGRVYYVSRSGTVPSARNMMEAVDYTEL